MTNLWRTTHQSGDDIYELEVSWDDEAFTEEGTPTISVSASVRRGDTEPQSLTAQLSIINNETDGPDLTLRIQDKEIVRMPLADLISETQIIDRIPGWVYGGGDLMTGCLLRAGLSSVVGQVIRCKNATRDMKWYGPRIRAIGMCLKENIGSIGMRTAWRAATCVLRAGF